MDKAKSPRQQAMEEVVASRTATLEKELQLSATGAHPEVEFEPAPTDEPKEPLTQPGASLEPTADPTPAPEVVVEPSKPEMVMVKVDDEEFEVPKSDIDKSGSVAIYQMEKALSKRLKAANELQAQAKKQLQEIAVKPAEPQPNKDEEARNKLATLRFGADEDALTVFNELKQQMPVDAIVQTVSKRIEWDGATKKFIKDNADILQDADVQTLAIARENELRQVMQQTNQWHPDFNKFYEDLGSKLRSKFGKPAALDVKTRQEKKEAIVEPKTAAGRIPPAPETKPRTVAEMVEEQRKARHQPSMR